MVINSILLTKVRLTFFFFFFFFFFLLNVRLIFTKVKTNFKNGISNFFDEI
jgi:hypothetical protein